MPQRGNDNCRKAVADRNLNMSANRRSARMEICLQ